MREKFFQVSFLISLFKGGTIMRKLIGLVIVAVFLTAWMGPAYAASGRDYISIVGSSTVYPFATVVAEKFGKSTAYRIPKIESTGSGGIRILPTLRVGSSSLNSKCARPTV
jgi:ABC-type phosphate transport system substrate-binding protein